MFFMKYKPKTLQEQGRENNKILYILCQVVWRARKRKEKKRKRKRNIKKYQVGLASAWNAFLLNVFNSVGYLRWWVKLFHANEPEKEKLVLKLSILVLGKSCLFPWTWRRSEGTMSFFRYCGVLPWTTFCIRTQLLSNSCLKWVVWEHNTLVCSLN